MKPYVICHMVASLDGSLHPSRFTKSPDGGPSDWSRIYEDIHKKFEHDAWIVGRVTMAEMSKVGPHGPARPGAVERPYHLAARGGGKFAIATDASGKLHFKSSKINGDDVVVLLGGT